MGAQHQSTAMRIGGFVGRVYQMYAALEGKVLAPLPKAIAVSLRLAVRAGAVAFLLYFLFVPTLIALFAIGVLPKLVAGEAVADLVSQPSSSDAELFEGNEGFGLYKDGVRVG